MEHKFSAKLAQGEAVEAELDEYFESQYLIRRATRDEQRHGIDRHFIHRDTGIAKTIDYKADFRAVQTRNAFIETVSVDAQEKAGWAIASQADWILYYLPQPRLLYVIGTEVIRRWLPLWQELFRVAKAQNEGYATHGVLLPLDVLGNYADAIVEVP